MTTFWTQAEKVIAKNVTNVTYGKVRDTWRKVSVADFFVPLSIPQDFDTYQIVKPNELVFCLFDIDETVNQNHLLYLPVNRRAYIW